jgi:propanediol dehydratase small subunit
MNQDQIDSIVRKVLAIVGGILATHGATAASATLNSASVEELVTGLVMCGVTFYASHKSNATQPVNTTSIEVTPKITTESTTSTTPKQ